MYVFHTYIIIIYLVIMVSRMFMNNYIINYGSAYLINSFIDYVGVLVNKSETLI